MSEPTRKVLVSDFDGTMTRRDFYQLVAERLLPPGTPDYWRENGGKTKGHEPTSPSLETQTRATTPRADRASPARPTVVTPRPYPTQSDYQFGRMD